MTSALSPEERDALLQQFDALAEVAPFVPLTRRHMNQLTAVESGEVPLISLYLDLGPRARQDRRWAIVLKNLVRDALSGVDDPKQERQVASSRQRRANRNIPTMVATNPERPVTLCSSPMVVSP